VINVAVEGNSDVGMATRVVSAAGHIRGKVIIARGKNRLDLKIPQLQRASSWEPWVVFRDSDGKCPVLLRSRLVSSEAKYDQRFALRIVHTMTEAWLLADTLGFAEYFGIPVGRVPQDPEDLVHPKQLVLMLCQSSTMRSIRRDMVSSDGSQGPLFSYHLDKFATESWNTHSASSASPSLARAIAAIRALTL